MSKTHNYIVFCPACKARFYVSKAMLAQADGHVRCGSCQKVFSAASQVSPIADNLEFEGYFEDLAYAVDDIAPVQPGQIDSADWLDDELIALAELDAERSGSDDELPEIDDDIFREIDSELNSLLADQVVSNEDDYPEAQGELKSPLDSESNAGPQSTSEQDSATLKAETLPDLNHTSDEEHISGSDHQAEAVDTPEETPVSELQLVKAENDPLSEKRNNELEAEGEEPEVKVADSEVEIEVEDTDTEAESKYQESKFEEHEQALESSTAFKESEKSLDTQENQASPENQERQEPSISSEFFANLNLSTADDELLSEEQPEDFNYNDIPTIEVLSQAPKPTNDGAEAEAEAEAEQLNDPSSANQEASSENAFCDKSSSVSDSTANPDEVEASSEEASSEEASSEEASSEEIPEEESDIGDTIRPDSQLSDDSDVGPLDDSIAPEDTAAVNGTDDAEIADEVEQDESIHSDTTILEEELSEDEYEYTHSDVSEDNEAENHHEDEYQPDHDDEYQPHLAEMDLQLQSSNRIPTLLWSCASLLFITVLGAQIAWIKLPVWSAMEQYRPYYQQACELLNCELPTYDDIKAIEIIAFDLEADDTEGLLNVNISLRNNAAFPQRVPGLQLEFSSASGIPVDTLTYDIRQLLKTGPIDQLEPNEIIQLQLYVADPGDIATSYQAYIVKN